MPICHLLTHTSGVGDYVDVDEETENGMEQLQTLYNKYPVYLWERLEYYLPMITHLPPKFEPGERFGYSNSGFILLGLVVEAVSGISYQQFVTDTIITPCKLVYTGFYRMDSLPANTAYGVEFFTAYFPKQKIVVSALGSTEINIYPLLEAVMSEVFNITP